ncbi:IclR family transcriptional regulator [Pseudoruegeria sp. HB172150]|uniref:IclR family transcriptional regulator n=1 Tax=Pseudoruegeria sp. HB172150 TaxID=2721164 RepID=UPI001554FC5B|nr:IclR family transcriptional regulator [Pseudoruegeria sp. HB172150]
MAAKEASDENGAAPKGDGSVAKACDILDHVARFGRPVRYSEILAESPYPKATLYRFLQSLTRQGMLRFDPDMQAYTPGLRLVRLAHAAWEQTSLAPLARPYVDRLAQLVGETVHLAQLDNGQVLYVDKRNANRPIEMFSAAGKVGPAYCTGVGKAMLAYLAEDEQAVALSQQSFHRYTEHTLPDATALRKELGQIRARGYAFDNEEHEPGIICIAMPILTRSGKVLGALSVTSSTNRTDLGALEQLAPVMRPAAADIAADAQHWRFPDRSEGYSRREA